MSGMLLSPFGNFGVGGPLPYPMHVFTDTGKGGMVMNPRDTTKMWTTSGKTTQVSTHGDNIGHFEDSVAANLENFEQTDVTRYPTWGNDGTYQWLEFDGVKQRLQTVGNFASRTANMAIIYAMQSTETTPETFILLSGASFLNYIGVGVNGDSTAVDGNSGTPTYQTSGVDEISPDRNQLWDQWADHKNPVVVGATSIDFSDVNWWRPTWAGYPTFDSIWPHAHKCFGYTIIEAPSASELSQIRDYYDSIMPPP